MSFLKTINSQFTKQCIAFTYSFLKSILIVNNPYFKYLPGYKKNTKVMCFMKDGLGESFADCFEFVVQQDSF